jgi:hypothetical protein
MNPELLNIISIIEAKNAKNFNDPFYSYLIVLDEIYNDYLANSRMCTEEGYYLEFLFHLEDLLETMEKVRSIYLKRVAEYRKWRIRGFEKSLYLVLSQEADDVADNISDCICFITEVEDSLINYDTFSEIQGLFKHTMKQVAKTSKSISIYHLENLW